jgi:hypothetical protein
MSTSVLGSEAVVLRFDGSSASVSRVGTDGTVSRTTVERELESDQVFFARIVHLMGDHERLIVVGPATRRLEFEREYVEICHRPDRLVDVPA